MTWISSDGSVRFLSGFGGVIRPRYIARRETLVAQVTRDLVDSITGRHAYY